MRAPTQVLQTIEQVRRIELSWQDLAASLPDVSYFATPDWVLSWWETVGRRVSGRVAVWHDENTVDGGSGLDAVVPLGEVRRRLHRRVPLAVRMHVNLGSGPGAADHCGWVARAQRAEDVRAWLGTQAARRPLELSNLDPDLGVALVPPGTELVASSACPRVDIRPGAQFHGASAKFRKQLRAYRRRVDDLGVSFRLVPPEEMTPAILDVVAELQARRAAVAGWSAVFAGDRLVLHRALIERAGPRRGPAVVLAERDGNAVAALYGLWWQNTFAYYQTGWEPSLAPANLGTVLVAAAIEFAAAEGATVFDFLRGAEEYKYRFGATDRVDQTHLVATGLAGVLLRARHAARARRTPRAQ